MAGEDDKKKQPSAAEVGPTGAEAEEHIEHHHMEQPTPAAKPAVTAATTATGAPYKRTILIALDGSASCDTAFQWALDNFIRKDANDLVVLAAVRLPQTIPGSYGSVIGYMDFGDYIAEAEEQSRLRSHALIKKYGQLLLKHFGLSSSAAPDAKLTVKGIVMRGDPRDELVRKAQELNATALILGSRGLGAFKRAFLGSVSDYIVHHSPVPVIVIKHNEK